MRPRPEGRGERRGAETGNGVGVSLQCGHGPKVVENKGSRIEVKGVVVLQCGHGPKVVENRYRDGRLWLTDDFLQCGHGPKVVENANPAATFQRRRRTFNAATARRSWRTEY